MLYIASVYFIFVFFISNKVIFYNNVFQILLNYIMFCKNNACLIEIVKGDRLTNVFVDSRILFQIKW